MSNESNYLTLKMAASSLVTSSISDATIQTAATNAVQQLGYTSIKEEQLKVVAAIIRGHDVFAVLPTGFGKSLCFACLPHMFDKLVPLEEPSIVVIVTPLTAIMKDQVSDFFPVAPVHCVI